MITPSSLAIILQGAPFPGAIVAVTPGGAALDLAIGDETITFCEGAWFATERRTTPAHLSFAATPTAEQVHAEIRRVLAIIGEPTPKPAPNGTRVYRLLSAHPYPVASDLRLSLDGVCRFYLDGVTWCFRADGWHVGVESFAHHLPAAEHVTADLLHAEIGRVRVLVDSEPSPTWAEIKADCVGPDLPADDPLYDRAAAEQALAKVTTERNALLVAESTLSKIAAALAIPALEPHDDALSMVKRLTDAHAVVSQRLIGSQKEVAEVSAERDAAAARAEKVEHRLRRDDELREQIAAAVGLDGSASLALILDTVTRDRPDDPRGVKDLRALVNYHQAPIKFNNRPLTLAERAAFVIRRMWQGRTNAANEAAALRRELSDISDALGDLPDTAERDPIGDREEHLALSTAERIRLSRRES